MAPGVTGNSSAGRFSGAQESVPSGGEYIAQRHGMCVTLCSVAPPPSDQLMSGATVSVTDLNWDDDDNAQYYGEKVDPARVLTGKASNPKADVLVKALNG